jgi:dimethylhistidine N-methyltransferase
MPSAARFSVTGEGAAAQTADFASDVRAGLLATPKSLPCRWFYDAEGSRLFEEICELPEYDVTRTEQAILEKHAGDIAAAVPPGVTLVELGSGNSHKTRLLIEELLRRSGGLVYVPIDISRPALELAGADLVARYPALEVRAIAAEYHAGLRHLGDLGRPGARLLLWLGSNVGNFDRDGAARFLARLHPALGPSDALLIGIDLRKDPKTLVAAYDDSQGVTALFNLNLLARINRELGGSIDLDGFRHLATYDERLGRIQMHLVSTRRQTAVIKRLGISIDFDDGERIHTEDSWKYSLAEIDTLARASGFRVAARWTDSRHHFAESLLMPERGR